jgi:hypothetical protein
MFRKKQREGMGIGLHDREKKTPRRADEQDAPEPERPINTEQEASSPNLETQRPSQAEGERR